MHILMPSDVFPPRCGGAGWSAHALAHALVQQGHTVTAVVPQRSARPGAPRHEEVLGVPTVRVSYCAPGLPFVQNYFRHERFWPRLADALVALGEPGRDIIIHAQHVQVAPAALRAGQRLGAPVVITVRDHWPWDYFSTGLHANRLPYARQTWAALATDLPARLGAVRGVPALAAIPYILAHMRRRQRALRQASAVIAVSSYIAARLAPIVPAERIHVIPNMVDLAAIDAVLTTPQQSVPPGAPYLLFVGKLEQNKGAQLLPEIFNELLRQRRASAVPELVIAGDGPLGPQITRELGALGVRVRALNWAEHDEILRLMAGCTLLLFPSAWGEPLSRVLLEACAGAAPVLAMPTGGTADIIRDGVSGALEASVPGFARRLGQLLDQPTMRKVLGAGARQAAEQQFSAEAVLPRAEALYRSLLS
ncbi:MAG: glycosyltransferase family 4 protein [Chloroflexi bacterium SZAS-1]|nr:glycosyltransferase family 4 protein [Chloroflexi bacterium SZAS-1]